MSTVLDKDMVHRESRKPIYYGIKRWRSRGTKTLPAWVMAPLWVLAFLVHNAEVGIRRNIVDL